MRLVWFEIYVWVLLSRIVIFYFYFQEWREDGDFMVGLAQCSSLEIPSYIAGQICTNQIEHGRYAYFYSYKNLFSKIKP